MWLLIIGGILAALALSVMHRRTASIGPTIYSRIMSVGVMLACLYGMFVASGIDHVLAPVVAVLFGAIVFIEFAGLVRDAHQWRMRRTKQFRNNER